MTRKGGRKKKDKPQSGPDAPKNLEENARAYFGNAESFRKKRQSRSMAKAYEKALELGSASETPDGRAIAAEASLYLGHRAKTHHAWGEALERYKESVDLGRKSGTSDGLYAAARAAWNLGNTYEEAGMEGLESAFRDAVQLGRDSEIPDALEVAAKAAFNLAGNLEPGEGSERTHGTEFAKEMWREAINLGIASDTKEGAVVATKAKYYLAILLIGEEEVDAAIQVFSEMDQYKGGSIIWDHWTDLRWELLAIRTKKAQKELLKSLKKISKKSVIAIESDLNRYSTILASDDPALLAKFIDYIRLYDSAIGQRVINGHHKHLSKVMSATKEPVLLAQLLSAYIRTNSAMARVIAKELQNHWLEILRSEAAELSKLLSGIVNSKHGLEGPILLTEPAGLSSFLRGIVQSNPEFPMRIVDEVKGYWSEIIKVDSHRCTSILSVIVETVSYDVVKGIEEEIGSSGGVSSVLKKKLDDETASMLDFYRTASDQSFKGAQTDLINSQFSTEVLWSQLLGLSHDIYPSTRRRALIAMLNCGMFFKSEMKKDILSRILELFDDPHPLVRKQSIGTLQHYQTEVSQSQHNVVLNKILALAGDLSVFVRREVVWNLSDFKKIIGKKQLGIVLECLAELARDVDSKVRSSVPGCIGENIKGTGLKDMLSGGKRRAAIEILRELTGDSDEDVQRRASENLAKFKR